jgi:hypothetical protein
MANIAWWAYAPYNLDLLAHQLRIVENEGEELDRI